ncbi:calcyclin-binding protein [Neodiprion pinetum]|uniref:Calcyclin-binding protein n=1 Tax=Neodiprion lecontei TaxID=441921 RepID=A0A6J0BHN3_NEOLC|nr:calcyclin-binding protein [Neodiprion lecontei]XP_046474994.1 calcyclin-binding protein [Neodiprion pinetum]XP_046612655.1 calcyclin-binding protein [Neodiprion virginianus]
MSPSKIDEIKLDIEELNKFMEQATRQKTKDILTLELRKLQTELSKHLEGNQNPETKPTSTQVFGNKCYEVKLNNYAWDQSEKFIKIYITLKNVQSLPKEAVYCDFMERSIDLRVLGLDSRNYQLPINNLCEEIIPEQSYTKVKTDMIAIFLAKKSPKNWSHVTGVEKRIKESKTPAVPEMSEDSDPSSNLMSLMKKFYDEGDDDMKRTIAKAWTESQDKRTSGLPSVSPL